VILREIADAVFGPVLTLLNSVLSWLGNASLAARQGINPALYLGPFAWLSPAWLNLTKQAILAASSFGILLVARAGYNLYLDIKQGVKWW
jgi:hypothetical protein